VNLIITADDTTGAAEAAALCADAGWTASVVPAGVELSAYGCTVVDLRSRHVVADESQRRIRLVEAAAHRVHKIDSTLRGNWSYELSAMAHRGRRVLLIPAHPLAGRVCRDGVVLVDGVPVAETEHGDDPRLPVRSSRPSESLSADELGDVNALADWLDTCTGRVAVVDAATVDEITELVALTLSRPDVLLAGPASVVGAVARAWSPGDAIALPQPALPEPVVVVCASLHPVSRQQIARLVAAGVEVVASSLIRGDDAEAVAATVAERAHRRVVDADARSVVLVGGDTAAAFIGDRVLRVFGSLDVGVSLAEADLRGRPLRIACKNGGFGTPNTLVDLVRGDAR
jgi:4-hydroxythreonine-4-phosphate dehydrogenase